MSPATRVRSGVYAVRFSSVETTHSRSYLRWTTYGEAESPQACDFWYWLIILDDGSAILFDTGFSEALSEKSGMSIDIGMSEALSLLGLSPADVGTVVLSHLHSDHTGNLHLFRHSNIVVQRAEWEFWDGPLAQRSLFASEVMTADLAEIRTAERDGRLQLIDGTVRLAPGVAAELIGGHTPGSQILHIEQSPQTLVLTADCAHYAEELREDRPFIIVHDVAAMYRGFSRIRDLQAAGASVIPGHERVTADDYPMTHRGNGAAAILDLGAVGFSNREGTS